MKFIQSATIAKALKKFWEYDDVEGMDQSFHTVIDWSSDYLYDAYDFRVGFELGQTKSNLTKAYVVSLSGMIYYFLEENEQVVVDKIIALVPLKDREWFKKQL